MTTASLRHLIAAAGLRPADFDLTAATRVAAAWCHSGCTLDAEVTHVADVWEMLGEQAARTDEAAEAAMAIADGMSAANNYGGVWQTYSYQEEAA